MAPLAFTASKVLAPLRDTGGWGYVNEPGSEDFGRVFIDCSHTDTKGAPWTYY